MILLDTAAIIAIGAGRRIRQSAVDAIEVAESEARPFSVSAISAWELCMLERLKLTGPVIGGDGASFFRLAVKHMALVIIDVDSAVALESRRLPGALHQDPADRFIVATARLRDLSVMTSNNAILDYARQGHVQAIPC